jgi:hypothetical protein
MVCSVISMGRPGEETNSSTCQALKKMQEKRTKLVYDFRFMVDES